MKTLFSMATLVLLCSWQQAPKTGLSYAGRLSGTWVHTSARGQIYESWTPVNDTEFSGKSYVLKGNDTVLLERIRIVSEKGNLYYIPAVLKQNMGLSVRFTATTLSARTMVFENPAHDFPQFISYTLFSNDSLLAEISGNRNGEFRRQLFPMKRVKE